MYEQLMKNYEFLTLNERRVLHYIMEHPSDVLKQTTQAIGQKCNVSKTILINLSQKLGFDGFTDFRFYIKAELQKDDLNKVDNFESSLLDSVVRTIEVNQPDQLEHIAKEVLESNIVYVISRGSSKAVGQYLGDMLLKLNKVTIINPDFNMLSLIPQKMSDKDMIIAISLSGQTQIIIDTVKRAKLKNRKVISITSYTNNILSSLSNHCIYCIESNTNTKENDTISRITSFAACDLLVNATKKIV